MAWTQQELEQAKSITSAPAKAPAMNREQYLANRSNISKNPAAVLSKPKSFMAKAEDFIDKAGEFGGSAGSTIWKTLQTTSSIGERMLQAPLKAVGMKFPEQTAAEKLFPKGLTEPINTKSGKAGAVFGEVAQLMTPVGAEGLAAKGVSFLSKILSKAPQLSKLAPLAVKSAVSGLEFAGKTAVMGGSKEDIKEQGIIGAVTPPALKVAGTLTKGFFTKAVPEVLGMTTGIHPETLKAAFKNPREMARLMSEGIIPQKVRETAITALETFSRSVQNKFGEGLSKLSKVSPESGALQGKFKNVVTQAKEMIPDYFKKFNVAIENGKLDFDKFNSAIVSPAEQANIQKIWDTFQKQTDFSPAGTQAIAARLEALTKYTDGPKTMKSALIGKIKSDFQSAIKDVYPDLHGIRGEFAAKQQMIKGMREVLSPGKNATENPTKIVSIVRRLTDIFHQDKEAYIKVLKDLEDETGVDLIMPLAASEFRGIIPKGGIGKLGQAGLLTGAYFSSNPWSLLIAPLFSPSFVGKGITTAGKITETAGKVTPYLPKAEKVIPTITGVEKLNQ